LFNYILKHYRAIYLFIQKNHNIFKIGIFSQNRAALQVTVISQQKGPLFESHLEVFMFPLLGWEHFGCSTLDGWMEDKLSMLGVMSNCCRSHYKIVHWKFRNKILFKKKLYHIDFLWASCEQFGIM